jgi:ABC-type Mn2+/Zn2+ transport system permease subunit
MVEWLIEPLRYGFIARGLLAGLLAAVSCALLSAFVVWRGMAFIGDAIAHSILPGIVIAFALGASLFVGALIAALITAVGIGLVTRRNVREDTAIGVIFTGLFALGILLLSKVTSYQDLTHILFGNILGVGASDVVALLIIAVVVIIVIIAFYKELLAASFDPTHAVVIGLSPEAVRYGLLILIAFTVVAGIQTVGVVLVLALLVTPAAAASLVAKRLASIIVVSEVFAIVAALIGFYASYYFDLASGASIVVTLSLIFAVAYVVSAARELGAKRRNSRTQPARTS